MSKGERQRALKWAVEMCEERAEDYENDTHPSAPGLARMFRERADHLRSISDRLMEADSAWVEGFVTCYIRHAPEGSSLSSTIEEIKKMVAKRGDI